MLASVQKTKGNPFRSCQRAEHRQEPRDRAAVADEVVVHEEEGPPRSERAERVELCHDLLR